MNTFARVFTFGFASGLCWASIFLFMSGCTSSRDDSSQTQKVHAALRDLLARTNHDSFVIFEEPSSRKFVQFAGSRAEGLLLDLPVEALNSEESRRAKEMFSRLGVQLETSPVLDRPGGVPVGKHSGFQLKLGEDVDRAATLVNQVFLEIYGLRPGFQLAITEN